MKNMEKINATEFVRVAWKVKGSCFGHKKKGAILAPEYRELRDANNVPVSDVPFDEIVEYFKKQTKKDNEKYSGRNNILVKELLSISRYKKVETQLFE